MIPLEGKARSGPKHLAYLRTGTMLPDDALQLAGQMVLLNAARGLFVSYHPNYDLFHAWQDWSDYHVAVRKSCLLFVEYLDEIARRHDWPRHDLPALDASATEPVILDCEQRSGAWFRARLGLPTASEFKRFIKPSDGTLRKSHGVEAYANELIDQRVRLLHEGSDYIDFLCESTPSTFWMERGEQLEPDARAALEFITGLSVSDIGFVRNYGCGASPDGLVTES